MKELVIISGKGGCGKTSLTGAFAELTSNSILVDADVDAADLHLIFSTSTIREEIFKGGVKASIDLSNCLFCGECIARCQFNAIGRDFVINPIRCEGCSVCHHFCPADAVTLTQSISGKWFVSEINNGLMVHARLGIGEENSGLLISLIRKEAKKLAIERSSDLILVDGPPGIGCPVISSMTGADAALIITEPSATGLHDMKRVFGLSRFLRVPVMLVINKSDINTEITNTMIKYAEENGIKYLGGIPYDISVVKALVNNQNLLSYPDSPAAQAVKKIWHKANKHIQTLLPAFYDPNFNQSQISSIDKVS